MEHLDGKVDTKEKYSEEELQFHYFKIHDYDDNNMLDGLEIISALTHRHRGNRMGSLRLLGSFSHIIFKSFFNHIVIVSSFSHIIILSSFSYIIILSSFSHFMSKSSSV